MFNKFAAKSKKKHSHNHESGSPNSAEELYNIDEEIGLLKEVKDIQDELHILMILLETQTTVLQQAADAMRKRGDPEGQTPKSPLVRSPGGESVSSKQGQEASYSSSFDFPRLHQLIVDQEKRRKTLQDQAEHANKAVGICYALFSLVYTNLSSSIISWI